MSATSPCGVQVDVTGRRPWFAALLGVAAAIVAPLVAGAADIPAQFTVSQRAVWYKVPAVALVNQNNEKVRLDQLLSAERPALVEFFFTTCTTICGVRSARLAAVETALATEHIPIDFLSITIDPEFDTPDRLHRYATRFNPVPTHWLLLTGKVSDIGRIEESFDATAPSADKMLHQPLTFVRIRPGQPWIRIEGLLGAHDLAGLISVAVRSASSP